MLYHIYYTMYERVAELFTKNLQLSKHSELIAPATVECALAVGSRVLGNPRSMAVITACEEEYGMKSPWNSVCKFQEVISRASTSDGIDWMFESITDSVKMGHIDASDVSVRNISDRGSKYLGSCATLRHCPDYILDIIMYCALLYATRYIRYTYSGLPCETTS